jgi:hypothetical protein
MVPCSDKERSQNPLINICYFGIISLSVHPKMNLSKQYLMGKGRIRAGFRLVISLRRALVAAAILFPVLVMLFLTKSGGSIAIGP